MTKQKMLVTGGAGFIGSTLARSLVDDGHEVLVVDNFSYGHADNIPEKAQLSYLDITNFEEIKRRMELFRPDYIFHLAAIAPLPDCQSDPYLANKVNVGGTINVLEAARYTNVNRVIFASTGALYENIPLPHEECKTTQLDHMYKPDLVYPTTKHHAEQICDNYTKNYGLETVKLRLFNVYGVLQSSTRKHPALMGYITNCIINDIVPRFYNSTGSKRDYINVVDVVSAFKKAAFASFWSGSSSFLSNGALSPFNICSGTQHSVEQILEIFNSNVANGYLNNLPSESCGLTHSSDSLNKSRSSYDKPEKFWHKYPNLSDATYNLKQSRLIQEVEHPTLGTNVLAKQFLDWAPTVSIEEGIKEICDTLTL